MDNQVKNDNQVSPEIVVQPSHDDNETGKNTVVINPSENSVPQTGKPDAENKATLDPAMAGRVSALEKERNEYTRQLEKEKKAREENEAKIKILEEINSDFANDPDAYEKWRLARKKRTGVDIGSYETLYGERKSTQPEGNSYGLDPQAVSQLVVQSIENSKGWDEFKSNFPELDPKNLKTEEQITDAKKTYAEIEKVALALRSARPYMGAGEALTNAYTILNKEKLVKEAQTNGEAIGRQNAYAQGAGSFGYISGGNSLKPQQRTVSLTKDQQVEYDRLKSENPKLANKYAEAVADSRE